MAGGSAANELLLFYTILVCVKAQLIGYWPVKRVGRIDVVTQRCLVSHMVMISTRLSMHGKCRVCFICDMESHQQNAFINMSVYWEVFIRLSWYK